MPNKMPNKMSPGSFLTKFADAIIDHSQASPLLTSNTFKAIGTGAMLALFMTGCTSTNAFDQIQQYNDSLLSQNQPVAELKVFNQDSFKDIILNSKSGIYLDPFSPKNIITVKFLDDANANDKITKELSEYGLSTDVFERKSAFFDGLERKGENISAHLTNTPDDQGINLTILDKSAFMLSESSYSQNVNSVVYENYFVSMHEFAHRHDEQTLNNVNLDTSISPLKMTIFSEMKSDFSAIVATAQAMANDNVDIHEIKQFMVDIQTNRASDEKSNLSPHSPLDHPTSPVISYAITMLETQPDFILKMPLDKIEVVAGNVANIAMEHDYSRDLGVHRRSGVFITDRDSQKLIGSAKDNGKIYLGELKEKIDLTIEHLANEGVLDSDIQSEIVFNPSAQNSQESQYTY